MSFSLKTDLRQMARDVGRAAKNERFAHVVALTRTGKEVKTALTEEIGRVFDRPTKFTMNAVELSTATKARPEAIVRLKDDDASPGTSGNIVPANYLSAQIEGGDRRIKRFEQSLQLAGAMPKGWYAVPGRFARLDAYGNLSRGQIIQILSQLRITIVSGFDRNIPVGSDKKTQAKRRRAFTRAGGQFFAVVNKRGRLRPGVYQRRDFALGSAAPRPVVIFVPSVTYRKRFDFHGVAERTAEQRYARNLETARIQFGNTDLR